VILGQGSSDVAVLDYVADDGLSYGYQRGERSQYRIEAKRQGDSLVVNIQVLQSGWRPLRLRVLGYDCAKQVEFTAGGSTTTLALEPTPWRMSGGLLPATGSSVIEI
jgi:hypothetical protein